MNRRLLSILTFSVIVALTVSVFMSAQSAYGASGTSTIEVPSLVLNITAGSSISTNYTVKLTSGTTWGTNIAYKSSSGISASFSVATGDPTYSGVMTVKVSSSVATGSYTLSLYATGDDPSSNTNLTVNVAAPAVAKGTSTIELSSSSLDVTAGTSATTDYVVSLSSGTAGQTSISYESHSGISATFSVPSGVPNFNGTMTVSVASSVVAGSYTLSLNATGSDPAGQTNLTVKVAAPAVTKEVILHSEKTIQVDAKSSNSYSVSVTSPGSYNLTVLIAPGTYAKINNTMESVYNFTLATFNENSSFPSPSSNFTVQFFFVFEVNHLVTGHIMFVNSSGDAVPVMTEINSPSNWTSYTFLGGGLINNGSAYNYANGTYAFANTWTFNSTSKELVNDQFVSPVPWVFLEQAGHKLTPSTNYGSSTTIYLVISVIVVVAIIGVVLGTRFSKNKDKK